MLAAAREVRARAYVPYSGFHVGAALLAGDEIFTAVNVENASYPLQRVRRAERRSPRRSRPAAPTSGRSRWSRTPIRPPRRAGGAARSCVSSANGIAVVAESADGSQRTYWSIDELLPHAFGPDDFQP